MSLLAPEVLVPRAAAAFEQALDACLSQASASMRRRAGTAEKGADAGNKQRAANETGSQQASSGGGGGGGGGGGVGEDTGGAGGAEREACWSATAVWEQVRAANGTLVQEVVR